MNWLISIAIAVVVFIIFFGIVKTIIWLENKFGVDAIAFIAVTVILMALTVVIHRIVFDIPQQINNPVITQTNCQK